MSQEATATMLEAVALANIALWLHSGVEARSPSGAYRYGIFISGYNRATMKIAGDGDCPDALTIHAEGESPADALDRCLEAFYGLPRAYRAETWARIAAIQ